MQTRTCVTPTGEFVYGIHKPAYSVRNLRGDTKISFLGCDDHNQKIDNTINYPSKDVTIDKAGWVYEIPNAFFFKGTTYISRNWADNKADDPLSISLSSQLQTSLLKNLHDSSITERQGADLIASLPAPLKLALATASTDPADLEILAIESCKFVFDESTGRPRGLKYQTTETGERRPVILDHRVYDAVANNIHLPNDFKLAMVLRPGAQGTSEIVGEWHNDAEEYSPGHVFEYLRKNSYIPWGHYAANMADDSVRYHVADLSPQDFTGLRHLYYQRTYVRLAEDLKMAGIKSRRGCTVEELEKVRRRIVEKKAEWQKQGEPSTLSISSRGTIWGWNYGFDCTASGYRLHASHQQIHQQYAMVPASMEICSNGNTDQESKELNAFGCGDMITQCMYLYYQETGSEFFEDYLLAIQNNKRFDGRKNGRDSLIVYEDDHIILFVPKAQTSQWELQLITRQPIGNILEADGAVRMAIDQAMLLALRVLTMLGARMVTTIEYAKGFDIVETTSIVNNQRLLYVFLPKLPESPGGFSEAQLRWIIGHYPEDFAAACREKL